MLVLQIDDDSEDLEIFKLVLHLVDPMIKCYGETTLKKALALFDTGSMPIPDMVFLDINMPVHSGFECYAEFKKASRFTNTNFVFLSTSIDPKMVPVGCASLSKQPSLDAYVVLLRKVLDTALKGARPE